MSFNDAYKSSGTSNGLTLPSFINSQPTVGLSSLSSTNVSIITKEDNSKKDEDKDKSADKDEDKIGRHNDVTGTSTVIPTLNSILLNEDSHTYDRELINAISSAGKGSILNDESSDDDGDDDDDDDELREKDILKLEDVNESIQDDKLAEIDESNDNNDDVKIHQEIEAEVEKNINEIKDTKKIETIGTVNDENIDTSANTNENMQPKIVKTLSNSSIKAIPNPPEDMKKQQSFDFQTFLTQFKSRDCQHAHKYLKSFLIQFGQRNWTVNEQVKLVKDFQKFLLNKLIQFEPFNEIGDDELKINNCKEGLEKLILTRIYSQVFSPMMISSKLTESHKNDKLMDKKYKISSELYDWIELKHLDIPLNLKIESNFVKLASNELMKINDYKSPRDKIICILNSSKIIFGLIRQQKTQENADSFVPLLIYVLLKSKTRYLFSNLQYIERFRNENFLIGETSYYVSTLQIACNFIMNISRDQLTISNEEFEAKMEESKQRFKSSHNVQLKKPADEESTAKSTTESPSQVLTISAEMVRQSLSNSLNSFIQGITSDDVSESDQNQRQVQDQNQDRNQDQDQEQHDHSHRHGHGSHHRDRLEVSDSELNRIKQISIDEHERDVTIRHKQDEILGILTSMFPDLEADIIKDVMASCNDHEGCNVGECVDNLLALNGFNDVGSPPL